MAVQLARLLQAIAFVATVISVGASRKLVGSDNYRRALVSNSSMSATPLIDVLVIGAGWSGVSAAELLMRQGYNVVVLEARERIGGRTWTNYTFVDGYGVDLGGAWIEGTIDNPIYDLAKAHDVPRWVTNWDNVTLYQNDKRVPESTKEMYYELEGQFEGYLDTLPASKKRSVLDAMNTWLSKNPLSGDTLSGVLTDVFVAIELEYAADMAQLGLGFNWDHPIPGDQFLIQQGYYSMLSKLAQNLTILNNKVVTQIAYQPKKVTVTTQDRLTGANTTYIAKYAVVTLPLGVLQSNKVAFSPPLATSASSKWAAIQRLGTGHFDKVLLKFSKVFWDVDVDVINRVDPNLTAPGKPCFWCNYINYYKYSKVPVLIAFNGGSSAVEMESWDNATVINSVMTALRGMYGPDIPSPDSYIITRWGKDPYSLQSYPYTKLGATILDFAEVGKPIMNTLFWAGDATLDTYPACVRGAYLSGQTAAKAIIAADAGTKGRRAGIRGHTMRR